LAARLALADGAERTLDLQYYRVQDDVAAKSILAHVAAAAERGVRVRLLIDDVDVSGRDAFLNAFATHPNIDVRVFNPFVVRGPLGLGHALELIGGADRLVRRMHNKVFVADNAFAIVGGRNLGNEYFVAGAADPFVDIDLIVAGPVVRELSMSFDEFWNSRWAVPVAALDWRQPGSRAELLQQLREADDALHRSDYEPRLEASALRSATPSGVDLAWGRVTAIFDRPFEARRRARRSGDAHGTKDSRAAALGARRSVDRLAVPRAGYRGRAPAR
jgi:putative cardiolipin synthase